MYRVTGNEVSIGFLLLVETSGPKAAAERARVGREPPMGACRRATARPTVASVSTAAARATVSISMGCSPSSEPVQQWEIGRIRTANVASQLGAPVAVLLEKIEVML